MSEHPARLLVVIDSLLAGGAERLAVELACAVDRDRFTPHVLVTRGTGPLEALLVDANVRFTLLERSSTFSSGAMRSARRLARASDIVHAHKFGSNVWGALLARAGRIPLIAHEHNWGGESTRVRAGLDRWVVGRAAHRVLCVSESVADAVRSHGVPAGRVEVLANGVCLEAALPRAEARRELGLGDDAFVVGIVAGLRPEKAHEDLLAALAQRPGMQLCIVGDGPRRAALEDIARELGVTDRVTWAGERRDAARLAGAFDVSVICSRWEGMPLAALEALSAGIPLVASAVGGLPDLLAGNGRGDATGFLFPPGDVDALASALGAIADDPAAARELALRGQQLIASDYDFARMVARVEALYVDALASRRRGRGASPATDTAATDISTHPDEEAA